MASVSRSKTADKPTLYLSRPADDSELAKRLHAIALYEAMTGRTADPASEFMQQTNALLLKAQHGTHE